jgi:hypothetical protein
MTQRHAPEPCTGSDTYLWPPTRTKQEPTRTRTGTRPGGLLEAILYIQHRAIRVGGDGKHRPSIRHRCQALKYGPTEPTDPLTSFTHLTQTHPLHQLKSAHPITTLTTKHQRTPRN